MKVMVPVQKKCESESEIANGFHNISFVCIYDSETHSCEWLSSAKINSENESLNSALINRGVFSIISLDVSPIILGMFRQNGITVLKAQGNDLNENIRLFELSHLKAFTAEESRVIRACRSSSCSSCGSTCK